MVKRGLLRRVGLLFFVSGLCAMVTLGATVVLGLHDARAELQHAVLVSVLAVCRCALPLVVDVDLAERDPTNERKRQ